MEGDSVWLEIVCGEEFVPEVLSFRDGQLVYTDAESAEVWLARRWQHGRKQDAKFYYKIFEI